MIRYFFEKIKIKCPFCNTVIVEAYDYSNPELFEIIDDNEKREFRWDDEYFSNVIKDKFLPDCEHVAYFDDMSYFGSFISYDHAAEMVKLAQEFIVEDNFFNSEEIKLLNLLKEKCDYFEEKYEIIQALTIVNQCEGIISSSLAGYTSVKDLFPLFDSVFPSYEYAISRQYVEKLDGPEGKGGSTYWIIFLRKKD